MPEDEKRKTVIRALTAVRTGDSELALESLRALLAILLPESTPSDPTTPPANRKETP